MVRNRPDPRSPKGRAAPPRAGGTETQSADEIRDSGGGSADREVGKRLKYLREQFGYSQRDLGAKSGLTHGTISFVERGKISPAVGTLRKILDSLGVSLAEFFEMDPHAEPQVFFSAGELLEVGGGGVSLKQIGRNLAGRSLQLLYEHYPPGTETASQPYSHAGEEGGIVIRGFIDLTVGNQTRRLGPGEAYLFPSRIPHRFRNPGPDECVIVSANSPPA